MLPNCGQETTNSENKQTDVDYRSLLFLNTNRHTDWMDGFLNPVRPCQIHLLRIGIGPEQPVPHGKQDPEIRPGPPDLSQVMHAMVARRDEEPLQFPRMPGHVHMHPVIRQNQHIGIERKE